MQGECMGPIKIQSQLLRQYRLAGDAGGFGFAMTDGEEPPRKGNWRQRDLKRAIAMAQDAGLEAYRVEIDPDGTISIVVGMAPESGDRPEPGEDLLRP